MTGHWFTHKSKAMVRITQCWAGLFGQIVWLRQGVDSKGQPVRDLRNRYKRLRVRRVMGLTNFSELTPSSPGQWSSPMYNPDDGRTYKASITLSGTGSISVHGCRVGGSIYGTRTWTRVQRRARN